MEKKKKNNSLFKYDLERHSSHSKVFLQHKLGKILPFCDRSYVQYINIVHKPHANVPTSLHLHDVTSPYCNLIG